MTVSYTLAEFLREHGYEVGYTPYEYWRNDKCLHGYLEGQVYNIPESNRLAAPTVFEAYLWLMGRGMISMSIDSISRRGSDQNDTICRILLNEDKVYTVQTKRRVVELGVLKCLEYYISTL